jgi:hypothetical protein
MVLRRARLILPAQLEGMGRREHCRVHATKVSLPGTDTYEYVRPIIFGESADLPDGIYALTFDGRSIPISAPKRRMDHSGRSWFYSVASV